MSEKHEDGMKVAWKAVDGAASLAGEIMFSFFAHVNLKSTWDSRNTLTSLQ